MIILACCDAPLPSGISHIQMKDNVGYIDNQNCQKSGRFFKNSVGRVTGNPTFFFGLIGILLLKGVFANITTLYDLKKLYGSSNNALLKEIQ